MSPQKTVKKFNLKCGDSVAPPFDRQMVRNLRKTITIWLSA
ncbi:MAG: hypothetical protein V4560_02160 [Bacteroidota bacterium]